MKKIPTIFNRSYRDGRVRIINMQHPDCEWVFNGEGVATRKWDGACCMIRNGEYLKRRTVKSRKQPPDNFILMDSDPNTGKWYGWVPVTKEDKWHMKALRPGLIDCTYELVGPKVQGNPEGFVKHTLMSHRFGSVCNGILRTFDGIAAFMKDKDIEGIVFHHPSGKMAKIKKSDYGMGRKSE